MKKITSMSIQKQDELEKQDFFQCQAGDNSLLITNYADGIVGIREVGSDDFYANEYFQLEYGDISIKDAIRGYINSEIEFVLGDPEEFDLVEVLKKIAKWSS
jgi:hypothetical protein